MTLVSPTRISRHLNGPRGSALLALGMVAAPFAVTYSPLTNPPAMLPAGLAVISSVIPIAVYGTLWALSAVLCWAAAFTSRAGQQRDRLDRAAWSLHVALMAVWALTYFIGWLMFLAGFHIAAGSNGAWRLSGIYTGFALFVTVVARGMPNRETDLEYQRQLLFKGTPRRRRRGVL